MLCPLKLTRCSSELGGIFRHHCRVLGTELVGIMELSPDANSVSLAAGVGFRAGVLDDAAIPAGKGTQADFSMAAGGVVIVDNLATERRFVANRLLVEPHERFEGVANGPYILGIVVQTILNGGDIIQAVVTDTWRVLFSGGFVAIGLFLLFLLMANIAGRKRGCGSLFWINSGALIIARDHAIALDASPGCRREI